MTRTWFVRNEYVWSVFKIFEDNRKSAESKKTVPDDNLDDDPRPRRGSFCSIGEAQRIGYHDSVQTTINSRDISFQPSILTLY